MRITFAILWPLPVLLGQLQAAPKPGHGHHEFCNAETYFLVGDALGNGMLKLLGGRK